MGSRWGSGRQVVSIQREERSKGGLDMVYWISQKWQHENVEP
jgi:hypothetical protein